MRIEGFRADADIVGTRIRVSWTFVLEGVDTPADILPVQVRRKLHDFEFSPPGGGPASYVIFDSSLFPPVPGPGLTVTDLPGWETDQDGLHTTVQVISVAGTVNGVWIETLRCTTATTTDAGGVPLRQHIEILDPGVPPDGLAPGATYYYEISSALITAITDQDLAPYRKTATATARYGLNRKLYEMLPEIYRRYDVTLRPPTPGAEAMPEAAANSGQLRRFMDMFGTSLDLLRSTAEGLRNLRDIDNVDYRFLPLLAQWIGWDLAFEGKIPLWRNEIKSATRLYKGVGTVPAIRAIVNRYTGWYSHVAEYAQSITRSNVASQRTLWVATRDGGEWVGSDDAGVLLGFGSGNDHAVGSGALPARLTGTSAEPFVLRPGMELSLTTDNLTPEMARFGHGDFADIGAATASEVCRVINRTLSGVSAALVAGGKIQIVSETVGTASALQVTRPTASLVTLEGAIGGRPNPLADGPDRLRLFYQASDPQALAAGNPAQVRIRFKSFAYGVWGNSWLVEEAHQGSPAAVQLSGGRVNLAWIENPDGDQSRIRVRQGTSAVPQPAAILGQRRAPFTIPSGARLTLRGSWPGTDSVTLAPGDFVDPQHATAAEVVTALNAGLIHAKADQLANGAVRLRTLAAGPKARLEIVAGQSAGIQSLGFDLRGGLVAGTWDDGITWGASEEVALPGRYTDLNAVTDAAGGVRLFWAAHRAGLWRIASQRWDERTWAATAAGVSTRLTPGGWTTFTTADGLASNDVRALGMDADGTAWFATSAGASRRQVNGAWQTFTTADGLVDNDVRSLTLAPDGSVWFATPLGASRRLTDGTWTTLTAADGLAGNNVRSILPIPDGSVWFATSGGAGRRMLNGTWIAYTTSDGLAGNDLRDLVQAPDGSTWFATGNGASRRQATGEWTTFATADGLASNDLRSLALAPDGSAWFATAAGVSHRRADATWLTYTTSDGLASNDVRTILLAGDGTVWAGTAQGIMVFPSGGPWQVITSANGLPSNDIRALHGPWSELREMTAEPGGSREPYGVLDASGRVWLLWAARQGVGTIEDAWTLRQSIFDPATAVWSAPANVLPPVGAVADREPAAVLLATGDLEVYFSSDRGGGPDLWSVTVNGGGIVTGPALAAPGPAADTNPAPVMSAPGKQWLFYRSDRSISLGQVAGVPASGATGSPDSTLSQRVADAGTLCRYAGLTSVVLKDLERNNRRRHWDDLLAYTPVNPADDRPLLEDELYTRGTIGLFVMSTKTGLALSPANVDRLRQLLENFLPINLRAVVTLVSPADVEYVYGAGEDIGERYRDTYPHPEYFNLPAETTAAALPQWNLILSNTLGEVCVNLADPTTWRHRTYAPPPL